MKSYTRVAWATTLAVIAIAVVAVGVDPNVAGFVASNLSDPRVVSGLLMAEGAAAIDPEMVKAELKKIGDKLKEFGEQAMAEAKKSGDMNSALKEKVDEALVTQAGLQARLLEMEQKAARAGERDEQIVRTPGSRLVESDEYKAWLTAGGMRSTQSGFIFPVPHAEIVGVATTNTTTVGVPPDVQPGIFPGTQRRLTVRDLITPGRTTSGMVGYVKETGFTNNAATVSEANTKPESSLVYAYTQAAVVTIAHYFKASKQILDDFAGLQSQIDGRGRYGLKLVEENQLLKGSGVGNNLNGIYTQATAYSAPISVPTPSRIDVLRLMMLQAELAEYPPTGIVLHPSDWAAIELKKDTTGAYIFANPQNLAGPRMWGLPVVPTQAMTVDTALVGAFMLGAQLFDREDANVVISTENQDDFIRNMITIRAEERLALAVYRPEAFIKNTDLPAS